MNKDDRQQELFTPEYKPAKSRAMDEITPHKKQEKNRLLTSSNIYYSTPWPC